MGLPAHRRGVGKRLAGARWLAEAGCAGKRLSGLGSGLSRTFGEHVLQGIFAVPPGGVGCGGDAVETGGEDDCEGEVAEGGIVCLAAGQCATCRRPPGRRYRAGEKVFLARECGWER